VTPPAVVLVQPRIPQNVGAIGRLCAAARAQLHVVRPIPFQLTDRSLRRAGMDYLELLDWHVHSSWEDCCGALAPRRLWFLTSSGRRSFYDVELRADDALVFGSEAAGLPEEIRRGFADNDLRLPMPEPQARCLNLATSAGIALWELLRQTGQL
jgi:tRNA (cytidine/uridine-2'-O-)-methyltransferase